MRLNIPMKNIPKKCSECNFRDVDYGGACELQGTANYKTFEEQYRFCPIALMAKRYEVIPND